MWQVVKIKLKQGTIKSVQLLNPIERRITRDAITPHFGAEPGPRATREQLVAHAHCHRDDSLRYIKF